MATYKLFEGDREQFATVFLAEEYGQKTSTVFEILDSGTHNVRHIMYGTNFEYSGFISDGTIKRMDFFGFSGKLTATVENINLDVQTYNFYIEPGRSSGALYQFMFEGNDTLFGSSGNDSLFGSSGSDKFDGGLGSDLLTYQPYDGRVILNLYTKTAITAEGRSTVSNIEDIAGSIYSDQLTGDSRNNTIQGLAGNDAIDGGYGVDTAIYRDASSAVSVDLTRGTARGGSGSDTLKNVENVIGSRFGDIIKGNSVANTFDGGLGNDTIYGGSNYDTVSYDIAPRAIVASLSNGVVKGGFGTDNLSSIEGLIGSSFNDYIVGSNVGNILVGGNGSDVLNGLLGFDKLIGGLGRDTFFFNTKLGSTNVDHISDFSVADDTIRLENSVFTKISVGNLSATAFKDITSSARIDSDDRLLYNHNSGALSYDADGSGSTKAVLFAVIDTHAALTYKDFLIV